MNRMILESDCRRCKFDEMRLAEEQIDRVPGTVGISMGVKLSGVVFFLS